MDVASPSLVPAPGRYYQHLRAAELGSERAFGRADRAFVAAAADVRRLERGRLLGAVEQADDALRSLAAAERYRVRHADLVPSSAHEQALHAARQLELGSRELRRAAAMATDPNLAGDIAAARFALASVRQGAGHYLAATEALTAARENARLTA